MSSHLPDQTREAVAETARERVAANQMAQLASVRVSPGAYFAAAAVSTFAALLLLRAQNDLGALVIVTVTWTIVPLLVLTDRIHFDGRALSRRGFIAAVTRTIRGRALRIALEDVERVEVHALRTLRRGGSVRYRYRMEIAGNQQVLVLISGGANFRAMARCLLTRFSDAKLDARALELRDHLVDPKAVRAEVKQLGIATTTVLDASDLAERGKKRLSRRQFSKRDSSPEDVERARLLRNAANDLRVAGRLRESAEAFRRALLVTPRDGWLIFEYARLLRSQAGTLEDARLLTRAAAALRLAAMRGCDDAPLLERIGESFLEYGQSERARKAFRRALEINEHSYRAQLGLAEAALSAGKLAHVIHHYNEAGRVAPDKATARMSRREADYYVLLSSDEDYLAAELRRMNWLQNVTRIQQFAGRVSFASMLMALVGSSINPVIAGVGWALASSSIIAWSTSLIATRLLMTRRKEPAR